MKYPIGIQSFDQLIEDGYVYIDKTDMVYTEGKIYFLSRPRRFGKSLLVSTLKNYFLGRKELFKGLKIDSLEKDWNVYPVFHLDFNGTDYTVRGGLEKKIRYYLLSWAEEYSLPERTKELGLGDLFAELIRVAHEQSVDKNLEEEHRNILKSFYSVFKSADEHLQFVFLTGVTKFSQVSVFSGFNQPFDISMHGKYETLCGISQIELDTVFREPIKEMSCRYECSYDEMRSMLKSHYDGYHFSKNMTDVYNPFSLLNAFATLDISDFWFKSGTPTYLIRLLSHADENMDEITGRYYSAEEFIDYKATVEQPLPMIYQSGYLTIKDFNLRRNVFLLDYPNNEVKKGFLSLVASNYFNTRESIYSWIRNAAFQLEDGKIEDFRTGLTSFLAGIPYIMRRKENERERERYFQYTFYLIMRLISVYTVYIELDGTASEALRQINEKGYALEYASDKRRIYKIGAVFSSETGTIADWLCE